MQVSISIVVAFRLFASRESARFQGGSRQSKQHNLNHTLGPEVNLDELYCLDDYYPEEYFSKEAQTATVDGDPCLTCLDMEDFENDYASPSMPKEICLAGYRSKYCTFGTYICYKSVGDLKYPSFCAAAVASGKGDDQNGYPVENICFRKEPSDEVERSAADVAKHKKELHDVLGDGKIEKGLKDLSTKAGLACLQHDSQRKCDGAPEGCVYYPSLQTDTSVQALLAKTLCLSDEDAHLMELQFSWNTGCVPRQADVPSFEDDGPVKLKWKDDSCFLNSALFSLFGQFDDIIPFLSFNPEEEDGCAEFIRSGVRNVVTRMRTAESVNYDRFVGLLRKGLPLACPEFMNIQSMQEIATEGKGNYFSALKILFISMNFEIDNFELKKGVMAYHARSNGKSASVKIKFTTDFTLSMKEALLTIGEDGVLRDADDSMFMSPVYGTVLVLGPQEMGLRAMYSVSMKSVLVKGACKESFSACIVAAFSAHGYSLVFPPMFIMFSVDLEPKQRAEVHSNGFMPKDFGEGFALPVAILEGCKGAGDVPDCRTPTYSLRAFGAASEIHQTAFSRAGSLKAGWVFHNDMETYVWAHEGESTESDPYDVICKGQSLRGSSTNLLYQIDVARARHVMNTLKPNE